jgi:hypothetical protein
VAVIKRPLVTNQEVVFKRREEYQDEEDTERWASVREKKVEQWRHPRPTTTMVIHEAEVFKREDKAVHTIIDCPRHMISLWLPKKMSMTMVIEEFQKITQRLKEHEPPGISGTGF